jgi:chemotaxis regulatin CheY-phosphate phosphatase CheZ
MKFRRLIPRCFQRNSGLKKRASRINDSLAEIRDRINQVLNKAAETADRILKVVQAVCLLHAQFREKQEIVPCK